MQKTTSPSRTDALLGHSEAREFLVSNLGSNPYDQIQGIREAGERKARAEGVAYQMEHERKIVLSRIASEIATGQPSVNFSEAKLERLARADPRYQKHIEGTAAAIEERDLAVSEYWALRSELEWDRAALAHVNASMRELSQ